MSPRRNAYAAPAWAGSQRLGDVGLKATLLILANYADEAFSCYPSQETIADETEQSVRTVRRQIELLREIGLIKSERRINDHGHRTTDRHYLQIDIVASKADVQAARDRLAERKAAQELEDTVTGDPNRGGLPVMLSGRPGVTVTGGLEATQVTSGLEAKTASLPDTAMAEELLGRTPSLKRSLAAVPDHESDDAALFGAPTPETPPSARRPKGKSQSTPAPETFEITPGLREWARGKCPTTDLDAATEEFLNHHRAKGNEFKDWDSAWRNWMSRSARFGGPQIPTASLRPGSYPTNGSSAIDPARAEDMRRNPHKYR